MPIGVTQRSVEATGLAIPDSEGLHARFDATSLSLSDQDSVTTWVDETGNGNALTAGSAPTYIDSGINGNPSVRFDGTDDFLNVSWSAISQPTNIYIVAKLRSTGSNAYLIDGGSANEQAFRERSGVWSLFAGNSNVNGSSVDSNNHIFSLFVDGSNSYFRVDGSVDGSGIAGSSSLSGLTVGSKGDQTNFGPFDVGEILVYPKDNTSIQTDVEQYLSTKWGITL